MRIDHGLASTPARSPTLGGVDAGGQNVHVARARRRRWPRRGHEVTVSTPAATTPRLPRAGADAGRRTTSCTCRPARRGRCPRTSCCRTWPAFGRRLAAGWRAGARPTSCTRTSGCRGLAAVRRGRGPRRAGACRPSTRSGRSSAGTRAPPTPARPTGSTLERGSCARGRPGLATCRDEVFELRRLGVPRRAGDGRALRRRHRALHAGGPGRAAPDRGGPACSTVGRLVRAQGRRRRDRRAAAPCPTPSSSSSAGRPRTGWTTTRRSAGCGRSPRDAGSADRRPFLAGPCARDDVPALAPLGRRRARRPLVRAVRHHPAGGDGLRAAGRRHRGRRAGRHRRRRRHRRPRPAARPGRGSARRCAALLADDRPPRPRRRSGVAGRAARRRYGWSRVAAAPTSRLPGRSWRRRAVVRRLPR